MGTVRLRTLEDMRKWHADVVVLCRQCGKEARFNAGDIVNWFRASGWSTSLDVAPRRFRCSQCGAKDAAIRAKMPEAQLPDEKPAPIDPKRSAAPPGIDPARWARASREERALLLRRVRS